jgi:hypothetical protein
LMNLTMFSPLIMASNSSFRRILHDSFSFTGPYILRKIFISNTTNEHTQIHINILNCTPINLHDKIAHALFPQMYSSP